MLDTVIQMGPIAAISSCQAALQKTIGLHRAAQKSERPRPLLARAACGRGLEAATHPRHGLRVPLGPPSGAAGCCRGCRHSSRRAWHRRDEERRSVASVRAIGGAFFARTLRGWLRTFWRLRSRHRAGAGQLRPSLGGCRGCRRQLRHHGPSRLDRIGSPVSVPSLQGHRRQNALRQVWPEDRQLAFERRHPLILLISHSHDPFLVGQAGLPI
jgi:hypothetical protein